MYREDMQIIPCLLTLCVVVLAMRFISESADVVHFSCNIGKYSTIAVFSHFSYINSVCISYHVKQTVTMRAVILLY